MWELTCYDIIAILTNCVHLSVDTVVTKSVKFVTCRGAHMIYIAVHISVALLARNDTISQNFKMYNFFLHRYFNFQ